MNASEITLEKLAADFMAAKAAEELAVAHRRDLGKLLEDSLPGADEGSVTVKVAGIKVTVTRKLTRAVDTDALQAAWSDMTLNAQNTFKWKADINLKHYRALQELKAAELGMVAKFITTKPASASVAVELVEDK